MNWLPDIFRRRKIYGDLAEEMRLHLEERTEQLISEGMSRQEAQEAARRAFGNSTLLEERSREVWQLPFVESLGRDLKLVFRRLGKSPGFAATVILTLAIGIGANTAVFSVVNSVLFKPLPYPDAEQLVAVRLIAPGAAGLADFSSGLRLSSSMYFTFAEQNRTFQSLGVWNMGTANVTGIDQPHEVHTALISDGVLQALSVPPALGRWLLPVDQDPHGRKAVMLGYGYWQRRFGGDRSVIGRSIAIDAQPREIVGVMPKGFELVNADFDVIVPFAFDRNKQQLAGFGFQGIARLKPGIPIAQANEDVKRMLPMWEESWPSLGVPSHFYEKTWRITPAIRPLKQEVIGNVGNVLWVIMATIGVVMLIACTNVANLLLVRADGRQQELAVRAALGAGRGRIAWELLLESVTLGLIGGVLGIGTAYEGLRLLVAIGPANLPRLGEISLDGRSLGFTLALSVLSGLLFGSIPVLRYAGRRMPTAFRGAGRTASVSRERQRSRDLLVVAQVAMAMVLLVSAMLMIRTFQALRTVDPGFAHAEHLQTMRISIPTSLIADPELVTRTQNNIVDKLAAIPGVTSVGFADSMPMEGILANWNGVEIEGKKLGEDTPMRLFKYVAPEFFHTLGTRMVAGRELTWTDIHGRRPVVIISESLAREWWGSPAAALGKRLREFSPPWFEVVGVVEDVHVNGVQEKAPGIVYWPSMAQGILGPNTFDAVRGAAFAVRSDRAGTEAFVNEIQQAVWSVNASLPVAAVRTMQEIYSQSLARTSFTLIMLGIAGTMAFILGIIGIYGVISYAVSQRTREIGIRLALGEQQARLRWMFVRSGLVLTGIGVAVGVVAATGLMGLLKSLLFGVSPLDPFTYVSVPVVLAVSAMLASYLPARRAAAVDPVEALRAE
ncbi:MAG: ABC transporter permease [Acidobacteriaceae bacterium]|jgi:predicted permease